MTKKRLISLFLFFATLSFALLVGGTVPYLIFYILLFTFLIPFIHSAIILKVLKASIKIPEGSFYVGEKITVEYTIENNSIFYIPYLKIKSNLAKELSGSIHKEVLTSLDPKSSFIHKENLVMKRRGYYDFGEIELFIKDVFGLFSLKKRITSKASILIYPKAINLNTFQVPNVGELGNLLINDPIFQDRSRVSDLRDYREGDSVKSIHWKLWPKLGNLLVKDYENRGDTNVIVFLNSYREVYKKDVDRRLEDKAVEIALSLVVYYLNQNISVTLETQNREKHIKIQGNQSSHIKPFLESLARFKGNGNTSFNKFLLTQVELLKKDTLTIIVTPHLDKSIATLGISLKTKNLKPLFMVIIDSPSNSGYIDLEVEKKLRKEGIPIYILNYAHNVKKILEG